MRGLTDAQAVCFSCQTCCSLESLTAQHPDACCVNEACALWLACLRCDCQGLGLLPAKGLDLVRNLCRHTPDLNKIFNGVDIPDAYLADARAMTGTGFCPSISQHS